MDNFDVSDEFIPVPQIKLTKPFFTEEGDIKFDLFSDAPIVQLMRTPDEPFSVNHTTNYQKAMNIFRGLIDIDEKSPRALALTSYIIVYNARDEAVWWYRRQIYESIEADLSEELFFTDAIMDYEQGSYQAWNHRRWIASKFHIPPDYRTTLIMRLDKYPRNFHAWSYTQWYADYFGKHQEILELTAQFIQKDKRNGSAWSLRTFLLQKLGFKLDPELDFAFQRLAETGGNEATCSFVRFLVTQQPDLLPLAIERTKSILAKRPNDRTLNALMFHLYELSHEDEKAMALCDKLAKIDVLRKKFWIAMKTNPSMRNP